jgi:hypothetical protein
MYPVDAPHSSDTHGASPVPTPPFRAQQNPEARAERSAGKRPVLPRLRMPGPPGQPAAAHPFFPGGQPPAANGDRWEGALPSSTSSGLLQAPGRSPNAHGLGPAASAPALVAPARLSSVLPSAATPATVVTPGPSRPAAQAQIVGVSSSRERRGHVSREIIRRASRQLSHGEETLTSFAMRHNVSRNGLKTYVGPNGSLTLLGVLLQNRVAHTPVDRVSEGLGMMVYRRELTRADFRHAQQLIGTSRGKISRYQFSELFGIAFTRIQHYFAVDGSLTPAGKSALEGLCVAPPGLAAPEPYGTAARSPVNAVAPADRSPRPAAGTNLMAQMEQQLWRVCMQNGIAIEFQLASYCRYMGMPRSPYLGELRMCGEYWSVYPKGGGHYRLAADENGWLHAVNVLHLRLTNAAALERDYVPAQPDSYGVVTLTPKASASLSHFA